MSETLNPTTTLQNGMQNQTQIPSPYPHPTFTTVQQNGQSNLQVNYPGIPAKFELTPGGRSYLQTQALQFHPGFNATPPYAPLQMQLDPGLQDFIGQYLQPTPQPIDYSRAPWGVWPASIASPMSPQTLGVQHRAVNFDQQAIMAHGQAAMSLTKHLISPKNQYMPLTTDHNYLHAITEGAFQQKTPEGQLAWALQHGIGNCSISGHYLFNLLAATPQLRSYGMSLVGSKSLDHAFVTVQPPHGAPIVFDPWVHYPAAHLLGDMNPALNSAIAPDGRVLIRKNPGETLGALSDIAAFTQQNLALRDASRKYLERTKNFYQDRKIFEQFSKGMIFNEPFSGAPNSVYTGPNGSQFTMNYFYPPKNAL